MWAQVPFVLLQSTNGCILFAWPGWPGLAGPGPAVLFWTTGRARPCWLAFCFTGPGGPKLARPLTSAVIGHAHVPRFSCLHKWRQQEMCKVK